MSQQQATRYRWHTAEPESIWSITGTYPEGGWFVDCLAMVAHLMATGDPHRALFALLAPTNPDHRLVDPDWITEASPLLLVHRGAPTVAYEEEDQSWLDRKMAGPFHLTCDGTADFRYTGSARKPDTGRTNRHVFRD